VPFFSIYIGAIFLQCGDWSPLFNFAAVKVQSGNQLPHSKINFCIAAIFHFCKPFLQRRGIAIVLPLQHYTLLCLLKELHQCHFLPPHTVLALFFHFVSIMLHFNTIIEQFAFHCLSVLQNYIGNRLYIAAIFISASGFCATNCIGAFFLSFYKHPGNSFCRCLCPLFVYTSATALTRQRYPHGLFSRTVNVP